MGGKDQPDALLAQAQRGVTQALEELVLPEEENGTQNKDFLEMLSAAWQNKPQRQDAKTLSAQLDGFRVGQLFSISAAIWAPSFSWSFWSPPAICISSAARLPSSPPNVPSPISCWKIMAKASPCIRRDRHKIERPAFGPRSFPRLLPGACGTI